MARPFDVPEVYKSPAIAAIKSFRRAEDPKRRDLRPTVIDCGAVIFKIARHFGFCFGVENAIDIAYRAIREQQGKRIYLLSEMIHNPEVNADLERRGVRFLMTTSGQRLVDFSTLKPQDTVIVPAFGTTLELQGELKGLGIDPYYYDATCPFVEKVWKRADELGNGGFSVIIHGKRSHEETRATFSHAQKAPTLVILNMEEAEVVIGFLKGQVTEGAFMERFAECCSPGFQPSHDLCRVGVVNQTTMLASETLAISQAIRAAMVEVFGVDKIQEHFADTRDTLCYATNENQSATLALIESGADLALVVGGYNSSNTSHLVELLEAAMPTFYIQNAGEILDGTRIRHFDLHRHVVVESGGWLGVQSGDSSVVTVAITSGASCPDRMVDEVIDRVISLLPRASSLAEWVDRYIALQESNRK